MPTVAAGEDQKTFLARAIPFLIKEGKEHAAAVGEAIGIWDEHSKKSPEKKFAVTSFGDALIFALDGLKPRVKIKPPKGLPWDINGEPCGYFRSEVLPVGDLVDAAGKKHSVTAARADAILSDFNRALDLGHKPHIPPRHEDAGDGAKNLGYVVAAERDGDSIYQIEQFIGQDAILAASRNQTSIGTLTNVTLQDGTVIKELWDHSACVPNGQLGTKTQCGLAAARGYVSPLCLSRSNGDTDMITDALFGEIKLQLGRDCPADISKDNAVAALIAANKTLAAKIPQPKQAPDSTRLYLAREVLEGKRQKCLAAGITTVAGAKALEASFCGKDFDSGKLTLARAVESADAAMFDGMMQCVAIYDSLAAAGPGIRMSGNLDVAVDPQGNPVTTDFSKDPQMIALKAMTGQK